MKNRILKLCLDILEKGNEMVDCNAIRCNCCPFNSEDCCLARIEHSVERRSIAETYIKKHTPEERNSTEKTFREVIADIKEGEVWEIANGNYVSISLKDTEILIDFNKFVDYKKLLFPNDAKFKLQRKQYTFEEAFKAYEKGIKVESEYSGISYKKKNKTQVEVSCDNDTTLESEFNISFSTGEIREKWYINN